VEPPSGRYLTAFSLLFSPSCSRSNSSPSSSEDGGDVPRSVLDTVLLAKWETCFALGLFRYDVTACPTRLLGGVYGFVAQLNEGRAHMKRPSQVALDAVLQPFDPAKFNFTKADASEVLFQFQPTQPGRRGKAKRLGGGGYSDAAPLAEDPNLVLINVSPIEYGHVLLVPRTLSLLPQRLSAELVLQALQFCCEADNPYFRVGYNSLGAYATVNHCHFQAYYLNAPFPMERAPTAPLHGRHASLGFKGVNLGVLKKYPLHALVFECTSRLADMATAVGAAVEALQARNVPFNVLVVDRGARCFVVPQRFAARVAAGLVPPDLLETGINPAVFECAGHLLFKRRCDYDEASQAAAWRLLSEASVSADEFDALLDAMLSTAGKEQEEQEQISEEQC
jgi:GDP-L-galactose phosphorylase